MELYSKEELLKELKKEYSCGGECDHCPEVLDAGSCIVLHFIRKTIDNLEPVIIVPGKDLSLEIARKSIELGRNLGRLEEKVESKRLQGEWIKQHGKSYMLITDEGNFVGEFTKCPKCLYDKARGSKFCPNCGANMRGKEE